MSRNSKAAFDLTLFDPSALVTDLEIELAISAFENAITVQNFEGYISELLFKRNLFEFVIAGEFDIR
jgi:hypothetical protein